MDIDTINRQIQAENDSYNRNKNRLQQELLNLKQRHQRTMDNLKRQKEQVTSQNKYECLENKYKLSENIFQFVNESLKRFM